MEIELLKNRKQRFISWFLSPTHIAPLAVLRIAFGLVMLVSTLRFIAKGWIEEFYISPAFHFTFYGFAWVKPLGAYGMYALFALMALSALCIMLGLLYRFASVAFFLSFTYVELIDKATYLNHYYFVSIFAFLLMLVPANRYFSLDVWRKPEIKVIQVPSWCLTIFRLQLVMVYFFAGLSKINYDWLIAAMPLRIWLPAQSGLWLFGPLLTKVWLAYVFSWFGAIFDLLIGFFLLSPRYRNVAYAFVILFHLLTGWFFKIGMFPYIMIAVTLVFFPAQVHLRIINGIKKALRIKSAKEEERTYQTGRIYLSILSGVLAVYFLLQLLIPLRYLLYPGKLFWTEEGYRFSWRVMLMEKGGTAFFHVKDPETGRSAEIVNSEYLTPLQETMMATQPDMILEYAHFLADVYRNKGIKNPAVTVDSYVTLNGSGSSLYIDSAVDLAQEQESFFSHSKWIRPFKNSNL